MPLQTSVVIIHGGCHVPENYSDLQAVLEATGYDVHIPRLPSMNGSRPPNADLADDSKLVRHFVEDLLEEGEGRNVVALMHSYGGAVGSNALHGLDIASRSAQGLKGGVSQLIYLSAHALLEGKSMIDKVKEFGDLDVLPVAFDFAEDGSCLGREMDKFVVGSGRGAAETEAYVKLLTRWNSRCFYQPIEHAAWRQIPVSYICTSEDMAVPVRYQRSYIEALQREGREVRAFELASGHCPHFTATKQVANILQEIIS